MDSGCSTTELLAEAGPIRVRWCSCGVIHLDLAHTTVRFEAAALEGLQDVLGQAAVALEQRTAEEAYAEAGPHLRLVPPVAR